MDAVLPHADFVLADLLGGERDTCERRRGEPIFRIQIESVVVSAGHRTRWLLTEVSVWQLLEETGLLVARRRSDTGGQRAQISLCDLKGHVSRGADVQLGCPGYGVITFGTRRKDVLEEGELPKKRVDGGGSARHL